ncbi:MAG: hypothetical protein NBKEAIPA_02822 [Nitrospirae bacterium]|nr:hypothetical protein [Nitrospirota bacterium]
MALRVQKLDFPVLIDHAESIPHGADDGVELIPFVGQLGLGGAAQLFVQRLHFLRGERQGALEQLIPLIRFHVTLADPFKKFLPGLEGRGDRIRQQADPL